MQFIESWLTSDFWTQMYFGNELRVYVFAAVVFLLSLAALRVFQLIILKRLQALAKKTTTDIDDRFIEIFQSIRPPFYVFIALYVAIHQLTLSELVIDIVNAVLIVWVVYQIIKAVEVLIDFIATRKYGDEDDRSQRSAIKLLSGLVKGVLWVLGGLLILQNLGVDVTSLIAGLGIGGVAVALALQKILGDLFSSFAIHFDKPFVVGDFIIVGDKMGTVEKIGIKTTRLRALQGEELVFSNNELTTAQIQNFKRMEERRVVFRIGVVYGTSNEKIQAATDICRQVIDRVENARFDRANFFQFGDSSLKIEVVYFILSSDYNEYMNIHERVHLQIKEAFEKERIEMAFPTRTIHLAK